MLRYVSLICFLPLVTSLLNITLLGDMLYRARKLLRESDVYTRDIPLHEMYHEYDFIVVGAGSSGATLAARLSEVQTWRVLLLEAGREEPIITDPPVTHAHMQLTKLSWGFKAEPQDNAGLGLVDRRGQFAQGKVMGGCSTVNAMMYTRGHRRDYDAWEEMGNPGWGWNDVLPYFKRSERATPEDLSSEFHGKNGELGVEYSPYRSPLLYAFLDSAADFGYPLIDFNSGQQLGFSAMQATLQNGTRCSSNKAFLRKLRERRNLHVAKLSHVTRILIDPVTRRAFGVKYFRNGKFHVSLAKREVIISAGAINTPKLLMLSGIGPREHLESLNIPVIQDAPGVGTNMQDHLSFSGLVFTVDQNVTILENRLLASPLPMLQYIVYHNGPGSSLGGIEGIAYVRSPIADTPLDYPDLELIFASASIASDDGRVVRKGIGITDEIYDAVYKPINDKDAFTIWPMITRQESRGWVRLQSKNPFIPPLMSGNYFADEKDIKTLVEGIKFGMEIGQSRSFYKFGARLHDIPLPACRHHTFATDEYWTCAVRQIAATLHHFCGTAKMGPNTDPLAVVDPELRVYGIQNLRVVDTSIIPLLPSGHTNAPAIMIGEKAADMIKLAHDFLGDKYANTRNSINDVAGIKQVTKF